MVRLKDGSWYEDLLCSDVVRYLLDYDMDGLFAADGFAGLSVMLEHGNYSDDMLAQFEQFTGIRVEGSSSTEKAHQVWEVNRGQWIEFYIDRWERFYRKLVSALKGAGKGLGTMDPWARGAADAVFDYGFDYHKVAATGIDFLCLQSREESWARRGRQGIYVWEPGQVVVAATIKAQAPDLELLWAVCTCNAPENWHAIRDMPIVLERQLLSLPLTTYIDEQGSYQRAFSGYLAIFGIRSFQAGVALAGRTPRPLLPPTDRSHPWVDTSTEQQRP